MSKKPPFDLIAEGTFDIENGRIRLKDKHGRVIGLTFVPSGLRSGKPGYMLPSPAFIGVDLAKGPDMAVVTYARKRPDGTLELIRAEELSPAGRIYTTEEIMKTIRERGSKPDEPSEILHARDLESMKTASKEAIEQAMGISKLPDVYRDEVWMLALGRALRDNLPPGTIDVPVNPASVADSLRRAILRVRRQECGEARKLYQPTITKAEVMLKEASELEEALKERLIGAVGYLEQIEKLLRKKSRSAKLGEARHLVRQALAHQGALAKFGGRASDVAVPKPLKPEKKS